MILPSPVLQIDTLAAEYPAVTNYLYCTYHGLVRHRLLNMHIVFYLFIYLFL